MADDGDLLPTEVGSGAPEDDAGAAGAGGAGGAVAATDVTATVPNDAELAWLDGPIEDAVSAVEALGGAVQPVRGVVVADSHGLCLAARGDGASASAGRVASLAQRASSLGGSGEEPVVAIETDTTTVLIRRTGGVSVAVYTPPRTAE
uniref:Late endosomal/lysosomal adaptor and MAPK and MTOR activator 5 n=1 Tax=Bicosoecida sp. CB-2014 TaxID=1486930 RepID=A0A7S1GC23_9STRA|mmetsp:Transcript_6009/g.21408  ORF Transcript_6009/g.21408 Transcript_6009/m.21408 type:complete len:148 (+) Transcript_6009:64-507(+)